MINLLKRYAGNKLSLLKLETIEKVSLVSGKVVFIGIIAFLAVFFFIFLNIGIGLLIGHYLENYAYGILIVANFYFLILIILFMMRKKIQANITNTIIKSLNI